MEACCRECCKLRMCYSDCQDIDLKRSQSIFQNMHSFQGFSDLMNQPKQPIVRRTPINFALGRHNFQRNPSIDLVDANPISLKPWISTICDPNWTDQYCTKLGSSGWYWIVWGERIIVSIFSMFKHRIAKMLSPFFDVQVPIFGDEIPSFPWLDSRLYPLV